MAICCHHQYTCIEDRRKAAPFCESPCSHLTHSVWLARSLVSVPFLHLAVWSMFPCHHFWWIHFTCNARLSHGCLKSEAGGRIPEQRPSPPRVPAGWCYPLCVGGAPHLAAVSFPVCHDRNIFDNTKESVSNSDHYQNKRERLSSSQGFHVQS